MQVDRTHSKLSGELLLILAAFFFAFNGVVAKWVLLTGISATRLTEARTAGVTIMLLVYLLLRNRGAIVVPKAMLGRMLIFGVIGVAAVQGFYFYSISKLPVSIALIIEFTAPIWITLYIRFIKKESVAKSMWYGLVLGFGGLILVGQVWKGLTFNGLGLISSIIDALALAFYFYQAAKLRKEVSSQTLILYGMGVTAIFFSILQPWWSYPFHIFTDKIQLTGRFTGHTLPGWVLVGWVIIFGTLVPYLLVTTAIKNISASTASIIGMLEPILAGIFAWVVLNETFNLIQIIGGAVVLVGIYFADKATSN
jgi:drug/metabolite transporter (DMT)-like permease